MYLYFISSVNTLNPLERMWRIEVTIELQGLLIRPVEQSESNVGDHSSKPTVIASYLFNNAINHLHYHSAEQSFPDINQDRQKGARYSPSLHLRLHKFIV